MSNNYYNQILKEIDELIENEEFEEALVKVKTELSMPYIPSDIEPKLTERYQIINQNFNLNKSKEISSDDLEYYLLSEDKAKQMQAIRALNELNLRSHIDLVQKYFDTSPQAELQALLIDSLIDQKIDTEFTVTVSDQEVTFIPSYQEKVEESDGFVEASKYFDKWLSNDNPSMYNLCIQSLIQVCYLNLPINYDEDEGIVLALSVLKQVSNSLDDGVIFNDVYKDYLSVKIMEL